MKRMYAIMTAGTFLAVAGMAQEEMGLRFDRAPAQVRVMSLQGGVMGKTVKGAPYSGMEINESTQMLADGTRIHNEAQTQVYRDSEGRMRRENGNEVTIWDPLANASWVLNTKDRTARKLPMGVMIYSNSRGPAGETATFRVTTAGPKEAVREEFRAVTEAKIKAEIESHMRMAGGGNIAEHLSPGPNVDFVRRTTVSHAKPSSEPLGKRTIEGVSAEGTRETLTIESGAIGNDRPIQTVTERWFSPELQVNMLTRTTDPRMGEEVSKLVNVNRSEPAAYLFQVPAGYQILEGK